MQLNDAVQMVKTEWIKLSIIFEIE